LAIAGCLQGWKPMKPFLDRIVQSWDYPKSIGMPEQIFAFL